MIWCHFIGNYRQQRVNTLYECLLSSRLQVRKAAEPDDDVEDITHLVGAWALMHGVDAWSGV